MAAIVPMSVDRRDTVPTMKLPLVLRQHIRATGSDHGLNFRGDAIVIRLWGGSMTLRSGCVAAKEAVQRTRTRKNALLPCRGSHG